MLGPSSKLFAFTCWVRVGSLATCQDNNPALAAEVLGPLIASGKAMSDHGFCLTHNKQCKLETADSHTGGPSCTPYSKRGVGLGLRDPATLYAIAFCGLRIALQEANVTQEILSLIHLCFSFLPCNYLQFTTTTNILFLGDMTWPYTPYRGQ